MRLPQVIDMAKKKAIFETFRNINSFKKKKKKGIPGIIEYTPNFSNNQQVAKSPRMIKIKK